MSYLNIVPGKPVIDRISSGYVEEACKKISKKIFKQCKKGYYRLVEGIFPSKPNKKPIPKPPPSLRFRSTINRRKQKNSNEKFKYMHKDNYIYKVCATQVPGPITENPYGPCNRDPHPGETYRKILKVAYNYSISEPTRTWQLSI